jgi:WD40 repeat protein
MHALTLTLRRAPWWVLGFMLALTLTLGSCGGGEDGDGAAPAVSQSRGVAASDAPVPSSAVAIASAARSDVPPGAGASQATPDPSTQAGVQANTKQGPRPYQREGVTALMVTRDGAQVWAASADGRLRTMKGGASASGDRAVRALKPLPRGASVSGLAHSANGQHVVAVGRDSVAHVLNAETGERRASMHGHSQPLRAVASSADGTVVATGGDETRVLLWDGHTGQLKKSLGGKHQDFVNAVAVRPDGGLVASGDAGARLFVWDTLSAQVRWQLVGHVDEVSAVAFSPDGRWLVSGDEAGQFRVWNATTGQASGTSMNARASIRQAIFTLDGQSIVMGLSDGRVVLWSMQRREVLREWQSSASPVNVLVFEPGVGRGAPPRLWVGRADDSITSWVVTSDGSQ